MFGGREAHGKVPRTVFVKPELLTHSLVIRKMITAGLQKRKYR